MSYTATVILNVLIVMVAVISMYILMGLTGIFSMGQASFMCIGAYTVGILATKFGFPFLPAVILAILMGMVSAFLVGIPIMKLRGGAQYLQQRHRWCHGHQPDSQRH